MQLFRERLDGDFPAEFGVTGTPDLTHAAFTQECTDLVVAEFDAGFHVLACR